MRAACEVGDTKTVKKLLEEGADVNTCDLVSNINYIVHLFSIINVNVHSIMTSISTNHIWALSCLNWLAETTDKA